MAAVSTVEFPFYLWEDRLLQIYPAKFSQFVFQIQLLLIHPQWNRFRVEYR